MGKKKLLFVIESLGSGGGEKSLISLLSLLDFSKYDVDLQLFARGGINEKYVPDMVNFLDVPGFFTYCRQSLVRQAVNPLKFYSRLRYSFSIRRSGLVPSDEARLFWQCCAGRFGCLEKEYDIAVAYAQGVPTCFVADKVKAKRKYAWLNVGVKINSDSARYYQEIYRRFDGINTVSQTVKDIFFNLYPEIPRSKVVIIKDIVSVSLIKRLADKKEDALVKDEGYILTVGRLMRSQKGYDILLEACKILKDRNIDFKWYIIGEGSYRAEMERYISENNLVNHVFLLGITPNPYPTIKNALLYVQTSRYEGYGLAIAEARLLNVPVVTTAYEGWEMQMIPDKNGVVCPIDAVALADAVQDMLGHPEKREAISAFQRTEKKGNPEELEKFYKLIES